LEHAYYSDGNTKRISWVIKTNGSKVEQEREHADIYVDKVSNEQSKYIALHVGIFWGIGNYIIKNGDAINIMLDSKSMYDHLVNDSQISDRLIEMKTFYIKQLIEQRKLKINYQLLGPEENLAAKLI